MGGVAPLRVRQQAVTCKWVLFHNPGEKRLTIDKGDVIGHARLVLQGEWNPEWLWAMREPRTMTSPNLINMAAMTSPEADPHSQRSSRTQQLVE